MSEPCTSLLCFCPYESVIVVLGPAHSDWGEGGYFRWLRGPDFCNMQQGCVAGSARLPHSTHAEKTAQVE